MSARRKTKRTRRPRWTGDPIVFRRVLDGLVWEATMAGHEALWAAAYEAKAAALEWLAREALDDSRPYAAAGHALGALVYNREAARARSAMHGANRTLGGGPVVIRLIGPKPAEAAP